MLDEKTIRKHRLRDSIELIVKYANKSEIERVLPAIFSNIRNQEFRTFLERYRTILLLAEENPKEFKRTFYVFLKENAKIIKSNNYLRMILKVKLDIRTVYKLKGVNDDTLNVFMSLVNEQIKFTVPLGKMLCGMNKKGRPIYINAPYEKFDYPIIELEQIKDYNGKSEAEVLMKLTRKYCFEVKDYNSKDFKSIINQRRYIKYMFDFMVYFINEDLYDVLPSPYPELPLYYNTNVRTYLDTCIYKKVLLSRKYKLPNGSVFVSIGNVESIHSILYREVFLNNIPYMLYRIEFTRGKYISGVYNINTTVFESPWIVYPFNNDAIKTHIGIENLVLEIYAYLTTNLEINDNEGLKSMRTMKRDDEFKPNIPYIVLYSKGDREQTNNKHNRYDIPIEKKDFELADKPINYYIKKVKLFEEVPENVRELAREFGCELETNETLTEEFLNKHLK